MKNMSIISFILIAVTIGVVGQVSIKKGLNSLGGLDFSSRIIATYLKILLSPYVILGCLTYFISIFFWLYVLYRVDLSFAYPFLALSYVLVILTSWLFLGEAIPLIRIIGVVVICFGVLLVAKS
jgi:drug/metabolite transporter (DMT)-like permease